jgi:hypothetical protein
MPGTSELPNSGAQVVENSSEITSNPIVVKEKKTRNHR